METINKLTPETMAFDLCGLFTDGKNWCDVHSGYKNVREAEAEMLGQYLLTTIKKAVAEISRVNFNGEQLVFAGSLIVLKPELANSKDKIEVNAFWEKYVESES